MAPLLKIDSKKRQPQDGTKLSGMKKVSMVIVSLVINLVTKPWIVSTLQEEVLNGTKLLGMEIVSMVIAFHVMLLATKPWTTEAMQKEMLKIPTTLLDVGHVTALAILLHIDIL